MKIGYTAGVFDLLHRGHLNILEKAKAQCDYLIVGVSTDALCQKYKRVIPEEAFHIRAGRVVELSCVDEVVPQEKLDKVAAYHRLHFDMLFVGDDWKDTKEWIAYEACLREYGVTVHYIPYTQGISSTQLRKAYAKFSFAPVAEGYEIIHYHGDAQEVDIPASYNGGKVVSIAARAFAFCGRMRRVTLPATLTSIGNECFYQCHSLSAVELPDSIDFVGSGAFAGCTALERVTLPTNLRILRSYVFERCDALRAIQMPAALRRIQYQAINTRSSVCRKIDGGTYLGNWCLGTRERDVLHVEEGTRGIADGAFLGNAELTGLVLPSSLQHIGSYALDGSGIWARQDNGGIVYAGQWAVGAGSDLTLPKALRLRDTTVGIGDMAFAGCRNLVSVALPPTLRFVGYAAFKGCTCLQSMEYTGNSPLELDEQAFADTAYARGVSACAD